MLNGKFGISKDILTHDIGDTMFFSKAQQEKKSFTMAILYSLRDALLILFLAIFITYLLL